MPVFSLDEWQQYKTRRDLEERKPIDNPRKDWNWEVEGLWGYEGVDTWEDHLNWYEHSHNPHAGGGSYTQSFKDFMENGPFHKLPNDEILDELYDVVRMLARSSP